MLKDNLQKMYLSGKSMFQMAKEIGCSPNKVVYWMKKYGINRRNHSEAQYLLSNPEGDPYNLEKVKNLPKGDSFLLGLNIGLYWGEGEKTTKHSVRVTNSDPYVILRFRDFLINQCKFTPIKIRYYLICFNDIDKNTAKNYWANLLKISPDKFGKIVEIPKQGKGTYKNKSKYGICTIYVGNMKFKKWLMDEIDSLRIA